MATRSRSPTKRSCGPGAPCAGGSTTIGMRCASTAGSAKPPTNGPTNSTATRPGSTAGHDSPKQPNGPPPTPTSSTTWKPTSCTQSSALADSELEAERQRSRKLRRRLATATIALVLALAGIIGAVWALNRSQPDAAEPEPKRARQTEARARELAATQIKRCERDPELAALLALESDRVTTADGLATTPATSTAMYAAATSLWSATLTGHTGAVVSAVFSPDGRASSPPATIGRPGCGTSTGTRSGHPHRPHRCRGLGGVQPGRVAHRDRQLGRDGPGVGPRRQHLATLTGHTDVVISAVFSPDGSRIVTASWRWDGPGVGPRRATASPPSPATPSGGLGGVQPGRDAHRDRQRRWDGPGVGPRRQQPRHPHRPHRAVGSAVFSPDGTRIVTASCDGTARLWDLDGTSLPPHRPHRRRVLGGVQPGRVADRDRQRDGTARVWDLDGNAWPPSPATPDACARRCSVPTGRASRPPATMGRPGCGTSTAPTSPPSPATPTACTRRCSAPTGSAS